MSTFRIKPLALALLTIVAGAQQSAFADTEPRLREESSVTAGRSISPADEQVISSSAYRVIHHIDRARDGLRQKDTEGAGRELKQAATLLEIIQSTVPTQIVKNRVWTADNKLQYDNTEEVPMDLVPVYVTMDERMDFKAAKLPAGGKAEPKRAEAKPEGKLPGDSDQAKAALPAAASETVARDAARHYEEVDLPLKSTRQMVSEAQAALARNEVEKAANHLDAALAGVGSIAIYVPAPLAAAAVNLKGAEARYAAGDQPAAKVEMERAIQQLSEAHRLADAEAKADVKQMLDEAQAVVHRLGQNEAGLAEGMKGLRLRAEVLSERNLAYTSVGWARLRAQDPVRSALIEAKRCVSYADIDVNQGGESAKARHELEQARIWLDKAVEASGGTPAQGGQAPGAALTELRAAVDNLIAGQGKSDQAAINKLKQQLTQAIAQV